MKKIPHALTMALIVLTSPLTFAASSTDLTVTGLITPSSCTPTLSNDGVVDFGKIPVKSLSPTTHTLIGSPAMQITVECEAATPFALLTIDNKPDTTTTPKTFGLGLTNAGENLGSFRPLVQGAVADGNAVNTITSIDKESWRRAIYMDEGAYISVGSTSGPVAARSVVFDVTIGTYIAPTDGLTLTEEVTIDGSATFQMTYL